MMAGIVRRLEKLEGSASGMAGFDLAALIHVGREKARTVPASALQEERLQRFQALQQQHAATPLRGVALSLMQALERVITNKDPAEV